jgi:DNA-binding MarR family transcriptional regulator
MLLTAVSPLRAAYVLDGNQILKVLQDSHARLGEWRGTLLRYVQSGQPDLTNRQMALLLVAGQEAGPHTVRGLAARLGVSKPVVTRALNSLSAIGLVARRRDEADRRSIFVDLTPLGEDFMGHFAELITADDAEGNA